MTKSGLLFDTPSLSHIPELKSALCRKYPQGIARMRYN